MDAGEAAMVLARAREGDDDAFRVLVERHSHTAFRLAFRLMRNEHDAEDVVQESFLRAYRRLGRFEARANFGTWLHRIIVNCALDTLRARQARKDLAHAEPLEFRAEQMPSPAPDPDATARAAEIRSHVDRSLGALSALERAAFTLRHFEGRSIDEIARALGLGTSAAKHSVFRAVRKLRASLQGLRPEM